MTAAHQWKQTPEEFSRILRGLYWRGLRASVEQRVKEIQMVTVQKGIAMLAMLTLGTVFCLFSTPPEPPQLGLLSSPVSAASRSGSDQNNYSDRVNDLSRYVDAKDEATRDRLLSAESSISDLRKITNEMNIRQIEMKTSLDYTLKIVVGILAMFSAYLVTKLNKIFGVFFKP